MARRRRKEPCCPDVLLRLELLLQGPESVTETELPLSLQPGGQAVRDLG